MKKDFYVIDCENFVFFPRIIHIVGFEMAYNSPILFYTNIKGSRGLYIEELERFKTFEEAEREATRLNSISDIKKKQKNGILQKICMKNHYLEII
jgi:hypothetical protein